MKIPVLKNNTLIQKYFQKIPTSYLANYNKIYYVDYYILYDTINGRIILFYDTSTWSNFYMKSLKTNSLYLQYLTELSLKKNKDIKKLNEFTDSNNKSYFFLKDGLLKFISNNKKISSWFLKIDTNELFITNIKETFFLYITFEYSYNLNYINYLRHNIVKEYVSDLKKNESDVFNFLLQNYDYQLYYQNAYIFNIAQYKLIKANQAKCSKTLL